MNCTEVLDIVQLVKNDKTVRNFAIFTVILSILLSIVLSPLTGLIALTSYVFGYIVCWALIRYQLKASFCLQRLVSFYRGRLPSNKHVRSCGICNDVSCRRHLRSKQKWPWRKLYVNKKLDKAIEHLYNSLIKTFITNWYEEFTSDLTFLSELRFCLRYATATAVNKFLEIDAGLLISNKLIPCAIKHIDDYLCMQQIAKLKNVNINAVAIEYLGCRLHLATTNRNNELNYIRQLSSCLMPHLLPQEYLKCSNFSVLIREIFAGQVLLPFMDTLADPNVINSLVILIATYKPKGHSRVLLENEKVELLSNFTKKDGKLSSLSLGLEVVLKSTDVLYSFMQFLKREGSVHMLQFCLEIENFNNKLILPDLTKHQLESLHSEALYLYKTYLNWKSPDFIGCSEQFAADFYQLLQGGVYNVAKLRTSEPLFQAYDHAFSSLENDWLPHFYHSSEFYSYICGSRVTATYTKSAINKQNMPAHGSPIKMRSRKYYESGSGQGTVAKISSGLGKIKGALQSKQPVEGYYTPESQIYESDATHCVEDIVSHAYGFRDLSAWRISIPSVDAKPFNNSKTIHIFNIQIQRIDTMLEHERHWKVHRKDQDFYILKAKLIEFHGENEIPDSLLPSRRTFTSLEARRAKYEDFLKRLLQKPLLRSSDLLYTFLTTDQDFAYVISSAEPTVDLENIYQSVANKLRKEKGQHLDTFMNTFLVSTGTTKHNSKLEWAELGDETVAPETANTVVPKTFRSLVFQDNFGVPYRKYQETSSSSFNPNGITESLFYLLKHTFKVKLGILKLYTAICSVAQQAFESLCRMFIERKLKSSLSQNNLAYLIGLLEDVILKQNHGSHSMESTEKRNVAFKELENMIPYYLLKILGDDFKSGCLNLLEILQNPLCNKQLVYNLMDIIFSEMYPQLDNRKKTSHSSLHF